MLPYSLDIPMLFPQIIQSDSTQKTVGVFPNNNVIFLQTSDPYPPNRSTYGPVAEVLTDPGNAISVSSCNTRFRCCSVKNGRRRCCYTLLQSKQGTVVSRLTCRIQRLLLLPSCSCFVDIWEVIARLVRMRNQKDTDNIKICGKRIIRLVRSDYTPESIL